MFDVKGKKLLSNRSDGPENKLASFEFPLGALHMIPVDRVGSCYRDEIGLCSYGDFQPAFRDENLKKL